MLTLGARLHALSAVILLVAIIGALPGMTPRAAAAEAQTVTVAVHDLEPFVMTNGQIKSGFTIELLEAVAKRENWTLAYLSVDNVNQQLEAVRDNRVDAAATAISITSDRTRDYDFSQPILNSGLQIMVPTSQLERSTPGLKNFLDLIFSKTMFVWLLAGLVISILPAHLIWLAERRHEHSMVSRSYFKGVLQSMAWSLGMLSGQPDTFPRHRFTRGLSIVWAFVGLVFVAYYTATLTANLTVEKFDAKINQPADLVGKRVCTVANTEPADYLTSIGVSPKTVASIGDCYTALKKGELDAVVFDSPVLRYYVANEADGVAQLVGTVFEPEDYGVAFPNGSELRKRFNQGLLAVREDGTFDLIKQKWFGFETDSGQTSGS